MVTQTNTLSPTTRWMTWLSASRVWAAYTREGNTVHSPESLCLCYFGRPVEALDYTTRDRRGPVQRVPDDIMYQEIFR